MQLMLNMPTNLANDVLLDSIFAQILLDVKQTEEISNSSIQELIRDAFAVYDIISSGAKSVRNKKCNFSTYKIRALFK